MSKWPGMEMTDAGEVVVVLTTVPDEATAEKVARGLVESQLAACVNLVPGVRSIYRWQGAVSDDRELLCVVKTRRDAVGALAAKLRELHPYQVPELLVIDLEQGAKAYLDWVLASVPLAFRK